MRDRLTRLLRSTLNSRTTRRRPKGRGRGGSRSEITRLIRRFLR